MLCYDMNIRGRHSAAVSATQGAKQRLEPVWVGVPSPAAVGDAGGSAKKCWWANLWVEEAEAWGLPRWHLGSSKAIRLGVAARPLANKPPEPPRASRAQAEPHRAL